MSGTWVVTQAESIKEMKQSQVKVIIISNRVFEAISKQSLGSHFGSSLVNEHNHKHTRISS